MVAQSQINQENVNKMVKMFYAKVIRDEEIGAFFTDILGKDIQSKEWQEHISTLTEFWLMMITGNGDYRGNPFMPHTVLEGLTREKFARWLEIFHKVVSKIFTPEKANLFIERSTIVAGNFMRNLGL